MEMVMEIARRASLRARSIPCRVSSPLLRGQRPGASTNRWVTGVMRFLQTEWHRHERDRNAWEIERQEMRVRIAALEGSGRRADNQTKGLRKYVNMLEKTLATERRKNRAGQTNGVAAGADVEDKNAEENDKPESKKRRKSTCAYKMRRQMLTDDSQQA